MSGFCSVFLRLTSRGGLVLFPAILCLCGSIKGESSEGENATGRPNILWLTCEDISPNLGCYGDRYARTPTLDALATQGIRYTEAVGICGVCAVNRSCLITGMYSSAIGSQDMRSRIRLPDSIRCYSESLRRSGYYCTNNSKTDYNFPTPKSAWDACSRKAHWRDRDSNQPFFAIFNYTGSHESQIWEKNHQKHAAGLSPEELHDPERAPIPPFHPDTPEVRRDWANYYDNITALDHWVADRLKEVDDAGLSKDTIVFFYSDHGAGLPMCKKWVWDAGLRVPLIIRFPAKYRHLAPGEPGSTTDRLVSFVDFAPTLLSLLGIEIPSHMQGRAFLGSRIQPEREYAFAIRDRMAERYALVRVVRNKRYQYHRNFLPHLPWAPFCSYTLTMPTAQVCTRLHEEGKLNAVQDRFFRPKPTEELYDLRSDPHMICNLAGDSEHAETLTSMRQRLNEWQLATRDLGLLSEYEMHRRSAESTQYEVGRSEATYPLSRILPAAMLASDRRIENVPDLLELLADEEPVVRWWAIQGLVMLGKSAPQAVPGLEAGVKDDSPLVRIAAAEGLYQFGKLEVARKVLSECLADETPFVRLRAMNVISRMGADARPLLPAIRQASVKAIYPGEYLNRMVEYLPGDLAR